MTPDAAAILQWALYQNLAAHSIARSCQPDQVISGLKFALVSDPSVIPFPGLDLAAYGRNWGVDETHHASAHLARAIAGSPNWDSETRAALVIKPSDPPSLSLIGFPSHSLALHFQAYLDQLQSSVNLVRYVTYDAVEQACAHLAQNLLATIGAEALASAQFVAIPRGGHIVLGMLSYFLNLNHGQLESGATDNSSLLVVVDDCAFTGARFQTYLQQVQHDQIVFAPVWSHPALRTAIEVREERVTSVISGPDLHDYGPELMGNTYPFWRERWRERSQDNDHFYWFGRTEYLCFPWSEPDNSFWNPYAEQIEDGWNFVPPEFCLEHRPFDFQNKIKVFVQEAGKGPLRPSANAVYATFDDEVIVGHLETGQAFQLTDVAAAMWLTLVGNGNLEDTVDYLLDHYDVGRSVMEVDLAEFVDDLIARDLLADIGDFSKSL